MSQSQLARGCQFGNHGEPFLWHGSSMDDVDIAIMQLINLANDNPKLAMEAAEFVSACVKDAAEQQRAPDSLKAVVSRLPKSPKTGKPLLVKGG